MKIAIVCHASAGGSGVVATELALALAQKGHIVHLVSATRPFRLTEERWEEANHSLLSGPLAFMQRWLRPLGLEALLGQGGDVRLLGAKSNLHFHPVLEAEYPLFSEPLSPLTVANTLAQVVAEHDVDLIHAHYAIPHALSAVLAREMSEKSVKVVTTLHGTDVSLVGLEPALKASTRFSLERSDTLSAVSAALAQDAKELMGVSKPIAVIPNWVDPKRFKPVKSPAYRSRFAQPEEALLLYVSNFRQIKAPQAAVQIFAKVAEHLRARMVMVGQGPEREQCIELAMRLGVSERIHFLEFTPEVERLMAIADLLLLPSEMESFGLVALEAMACAVPVVASRVGGVPEVVVDGLTGRLCTPGDLRGMAQAVLEILTNPYRQFEMGQAGRERATAVFSVDKVLPKYLELYRQTCAYR